MCKGCRQFSHRWKKHEQKLKSPLSVHQFVRLILTKLGQNIHPTVSEKSCVIRYICGRIRLMHYAVSGTQTDKETLCLRNWWKPNQSKANHSALASLQANSIPHEYVAGKADFLSSELMNKLQLSTVNKTKLKWTEMQTLTQTSETLQGLHLIFWDICFNQAQTRET